MQPQRVSVVVLGFFQRKLGRALATQLTANETVLEVSTVKEHCNFRVRKLGVVRRREHSGCI